MGPLDKEGLFYFVAIANLTCDPRQSDRPSVESSCTL